MSDDTLEKFGREILRRIQRSEKSIVADVPNRHIHLFQGNLTRLFGTGIVASKHMVKIVMELR